MYNEMINELTKFEEIELIFSNTKVNEKNRTISYTVVVNGDNVLSNINMCKKIIAVMEIIKELFTKYNIIFKYDIMSSSFLEKAILDNNKKIIHRLAEAEKIYSKDDYFQELIENNYNNRTRA